MIHPHTCLKFISSEVGFGVFATQPIKKGTITWAQDSLDRRFSPKELAALGPLFTKTLDTYSYRDRDGDYIFCWDNGRFVNHSFNSNCLTTAYDFEIAIRDIAEGEELTDDYGYLNINEPFTPTPEPNSERTKVYPDDLMRYHKKWDASLIEATGNLNKVPQPLQSLINKKSWEELQRVVRGEQKMKSIKTCYFDRSRNSNSQAMTLDSK